MKYAIYYCLIVLSLLSASCDILVGDDEYNNNRVPIDLIETESEVYFTLDSCFIKLQEYIEFTYLFDAVFTQKITPPSSSWQDIYNHNIGYENQMISELWSDAYEIIYAVNNIFESIDNLDFTETEKNLILARGTAIRGFLYYNLINWFGGIPLQLTSVHQTEQKVAAEEVYWFIMSDLDFSTGVLPIQPTGNGITLNKELTMGILASASLDFANWNQARGNSISIINNGNYALNNTKYNFSINNPEIIFGFDKGENQEFNNNFTSGDIIPVYRYTETILVVSEVEMNMGNFVAALDWLNMIRNRSGEEIISQIPSMNDLKELIFEQWMSEFIMEGNTFRTLKRFEKAESMLNLTPLQLILPIPAIEIDYNPNMIQNPGY